ncbi:ribosomal protein S7 domain-containing protein [Copromyces sp. CBS 386.78]|uniref:Small ribosomal subunit protein uS7m n=1 Tax=Pseudoneurospora amorphoporcata TaxID=241081 RepID=A0AAN6P372_9PEZI|nr:ribosomal protein S7 domain-containing protein [Copromyces sp. CBS 386.78]KAK3956731.1 ribosomal protein S7 domain-containing protein [Pseudoneurospora amorphoporcata]
MPARLGLSAAFRSLSIRTNQLPQKQSIAAAVQARTYITDSATSSRLPPRVQQQQQHRTQPFSTETTPSTNSNNGDLAPPVQVTPENASALSQLSEIAYGVKAADVSLEGHKYGLPTLPLPSELHHKYRYSEVVNHATKLLMKDGKLSKAQRDMAMILNYLRSSPPPKLNPARPLVPGHPPASHLPLNPVEYLTVAIDSVAPLIKMRGYKGLAGGGRSLEVPQPIPARQRRSTAFKWILDVVNKKPSKGSGRTMFAHRVAEEIVAVVEGRSSVWDKRLLLHKQGTANRANLNSPALMMKGKKM